MTSLLEHLLINRPEDAGYTLSALERGEINLALYERDPHLISMALHATAKEWKARRKTDDLLKIIQILTQNGWQAWPDGDKGFNPFEEAIKTESASITKWVAEQPDAPNSLFSTPYQEEGVSAVNALFLSIEHAPMIQALFDLGVDPNLRDKMGNTALHRAKSPEVVDVLIRNGADPNAINSQGHDPVAAWSQQMIVVKDRQAMEEILNAARPVDPVRTLREFGAAMQKVGVQQAKNRLSEAGIDPKTARYKGLDLVDLAIGEALESVWKTDTYRHYDGHPLSHRKWRKILLATIRMQGGIESKTDPTEAQNMRDGIAIFLTLDRAMTSATLAEELREEEMRRERKHSKSPAVDDSANELSKLIGFSNAKELFAARVPLERTLAWFDRLQTAGVLRDNASRIARHLISPGVSGHWLHRGQDMKSPVNFLELVKRATREAWDRDFGSSPSALRHIPAGEKPVVGESMVRAVAHMPHAIGALTLLFDESAPQLLERIIDDSTPVIADDPWMEAAIETQRKIDQKVCRDFGNYLASTYESKSLAQKTPEARAPRSVRRM